MTAALVGLALSAAGGGAAQAADWYVQIVLPDQMFAVDLDSQVRDGDYATLTVLNIPATDVRFGSKRMKWSLSSYRFDCVRRSVTVLSMVAYDADGNEIARAGPTGKTEPLRVDDNGALALNCDRKTRPSMVHFRDIEGVRGFYADWLRKRGG